MLLPSFLDDRHSFALESVPFIFVQNFEGPLWVAKPIDLTYDAIGVPTGQVRLRDNDQDRKAFLESYRYRLK